MDIERIDPPGMAFAGMSQAVRAGDWLQVSGQVALREGAVVGADDPVAQAEQCFANIGTVLAAAGADLSAVVKLVCYLTERNAYAGFAAVRNRLFAGHAPASSVVVVKELLLPGLLMEIEALAWLPVADTHPIAGEAGS